MTGICGLIVHRRGADAANEFARMLATLARFPHAAVDQVQVGQTFLGRVANGADLVRDPSRQPWCIGDWTIVNQARLDEPAAAGCEAAFDDGERPDGLLLAQVLAHGREDTFGRMPGDWIQAGWNNVERSLRVVREPYGFSSLYYVDVGGFFAFASSMASLLALDACKPTLDENIVARSITRWVGDGGHGTVFKGIRFLPPGQSLSWQDGTVTIRRYWKMEAAFSPLKVGYHEAAHGLRHVLERAVDRRVARAGKIACTLSSGLDSSSVTALASRRTSASGLSLDAYCSVPLHRDRMRPPRGRFGDEEPIARAFAETLAKVRFIPIDSADITPIQGLERTVDTACQPFYATSNDHWLHSLYARAAADGNDTVLNGATGNLTMSWGMLRTQPLASLLINGRWRSVAIQWRQRNPLGAAARQRRRDRRAGEPWRGYSCIAPAFAERLQLDRRMLEAERDSTQDFREYDSGRDERLDWLAPHIGVGVFQDVLSRRYGLHIADPSADTELILYTLSLPERVFNGPRQTPRWLFREVTRDLLPDSIRSNALRGYQAADLGARLIEDAARMEDLLERLDVHPMAREVLDIARLRSIWNDVRENNTVQAQQAAWAILLNGLATGLFLLQYG